jgi:hypothetical protein
MAKLRRRATTSASGRVALPDVRVPIELVLSERAGVSLRLTPEQQEVRRAVRLDLAEASMGTPFDPRRWLDVAETEQARNAWQRDRDEWAREILAADPRVEVIEVGNRTEGPAGCPDALAGASVPINKRGGGPTSA